MNASQPAQKKYFTVEEANATLPLVSSILRLHITALAKELQVHHQKLIEFQETPKLTPVQHEALQALAAQFEHDQEKMHEYEQELRNLNVELKDYFTGLVDFPGWLNDNEVYLCWRLGEPEVAHWHELDSGFAGRKKLPPGRQV